MNSVYSIPGWYHAGAETMYMISDSISAAPGFNRG